MIKERMSRAITSWLPLSAVAAGIVMTPASILKRPVAKRITAAIASGAMTSSAFLRRSYGKEKAQADYAQTS